MKIVSFNINGLRARGHQLRAVIDRHSPDVIGLQETKVLDAQFPIEDIRGLGYNAVYHGQKGHYGVALLHRTPPQESLCGFPDDGEDSQRRLVRGSYRFGKRTVHVYNGYFPQGESRDHPLKFPAKQAFYHNLLSHLHQYHDPGEDVIVVGDMNIAPEDIDIGIGEDNRKRWLRTGKCCFLPEERQWLDSLTAWGLTDCFRSLNQQTKDAYSWFDYRSRGFEQIPPRGLRIDLILATSSLMENCTDTGIDLFIRGMEMPSDHCPIWAEFKF
ncbi:MAG: exodeoxyribonuclease III [Porticoccaceae bacterium]